MEKKHDIASRRQRLKAHVRKVNFSCNTCFYCNAEDDGYDFTGGSEWYQCRRYPPNQIQNFDIKDETIFNDFPNVSLDEWCGEYKPITKNRKVR